MPDELAERLWRLDRPLTAAEYHALIEQYKIYVEMADRISARRGLANTFFLTLNSTVFTFVGVFLGEQLHLVASKVWLVLPFLTLSIQCLAWFGLIRSYRQLNAAKYRVIGELETRLPASPYWRAEWFTLGKGKDKVRYWPLTHIEQWVPLLFLIIYMTGFVVVLMG